MAEREEVRRGFTRLWLGQQQGSRPWGTCMIADRGFERELTQAVTRNIPGAVSPRVWCENNDVAFLIPFQEADDDGIQYDRVAHLTHILPMDQCTVIQSSVISVIFLSPSPRAPCPV